MYGPRNEANMYKNTVDSSSIRFPSHTKHSSRHQQSPSLSQYSAHRTGQPSQDHHGYPQRDRNRNCFSRPRRHARSQTARYRGLALPFRYQLRGVARNTAHPLWSRPAIHLAIQLCRALPSRRQGCRTFLDRLGALFQSGCHADSRPNRENPLDSSLHLHVRHSAVHARRREGDRRRFAEVGG